jgi:hypothetical protein
VRRLLEAQAAAGQGQSAVLMHVSTVVGRY